jgi:hypothetical protein
LPNKGIRFSIKARIFLPNQLYDLIKIQILHC